MKAVLVLGVLIALVGADIAAARTTALHHPHRHHHHVRHARHRHVRRAVPAAAHGRARHHYSALALAQLSRRRAAAAAAQDGAARRRQDGIVRADGHAGWGLQRGRSEAIVGAYRRPPDPNLPAPKMYNESRGAAGVQVTMPLGH